MTSKRVRSRERGGRDKLNSQVHFQCESKKEIYREFQRIDFFHSISIFAIIDSYMNKILSLIKQCTGISSSSWIFEENQPINNNQNNNVSTISSITLKESQSDLITSSNFLSSHLCNRDVDFLSFDFSQTISCLDT